MSRITLNNKLKKRSDYDEILKKVHAVPDPLNYVRNTFNCSFTCAKRFLIETGIAEKELEPSEQAKRLIEDMDAKFTPERKPDFKTLRSQWRFIESQSQAVLKEVFDLLTGNKTEATKEMLVLAISYLVQYRYYPIVFNKEVPDSIKQKMDTAVKDCIKRD